MPDIDEDKLEEIREQKKEQLKEQQQNQEEELQQQAQQQAEAQKKAMLRKHLTDGARKRLNSVRMSKPDFAEQAEQQILALAQSGRLNQKITEEQMKEILKELKPDSNDYDIHRV
ncbi:MAG: DNA-binding protein [Halobacteriaceae archaeon]